MSLFDDAVEITLKNEGGYVYDPNDPGGETNHGISSKSYPRIDIKSLTRDEAQEIYRRDYWEPLKLDDFPYSYLDDVAMKIFDMNVLMGKHYAVVCLQRAIRACLLCDIADDGILGPITRAKINDTKGVELLCAYRSECAAYYRSLKNIRFIDGWLNRAYS